ncbi:MAG TPA: ABC transporter ATP-binding protein [Nitrospirae bacterium]|nr:sulfate/thiosulfate import ATP-binding protein CysA [bacterium BMS3Abin06]HDH10765.1 ABC transporter ATP-binding protein [Nitrospirota bacterium]HDZ03053.1 ABC transporter ATP-binding protein [Nitrospirota bacterium]
MLSIEHLTKRYGDTEAVKDLTLELSLNEILAIIGPSGCGKTTLLRLTAGFESPDKGWILIDGVEASTPNHLIEPYRRSLSMIFQDLALWPHMTVKEHVEFVLKKNKLSRGDINLKIDRNLEDVNLNGYGNRRPHELSGGERQRLAIARALASEPTYLLMDEPFSNLDSILKDDLQELLLSLKNHHEMSIMYVTHNIEEALALADRIAVINKGRLEQIDTKDNILNNPKNNFVRRLLRIK